ncbi:hypothetical protein VIGAN_04243400, partial [Vigna angularis var. angularis]
HKATLQPQNKTTSIPPKSHHPFHYSILIMTCLSSLLFTHLFLYFNSLSPSLFFPSTSLLCPLFSIYYLVLY